MTREELKTILELQNREIIQAYKDIYAYDVMTLDKEGNIDKDQIYNPDNVATTYDGNEHHLIYLYPYTEIIQDFNPNIPGTLDLSWVKTIGNTFSPTVKDSIVIRNADVFGKFEPKCKRMFLTNSVVESLIYNKIDLSKCECEEIRLIPHELNTIPVIEFVKNFNNR